GINVAGLYVDAAYLFNETLGNTLVLSAEFSLGGLLGGDEPYSEESPVAVAYEVPVEPEQVSQSRIRELETPVADDTNTDFTESDVLLNLIRTRAEASLPDGILTSCEEFILAALLQGIRADYRTSPEPSNNAARAAFLEWLIRAVPSLVPAEIIWEGAEIAGIDIQGDLSLSHADIAFPIAFDSCTAEAIDLDGCSVPRLSFRNTTCTSLSGRNLRVDGDVILQNLTTTNGVILEGARIGGDLRLEDAKLGGTSMLSLDCDQIYVRGSVMMGSSGASDAGTLFEAHSGMSFVGAEIGGDLVCAGRMKAPIENGSLALMAQRISVGGSVFLSPGSYVAGEVNLVGARILSSLVISGATLSNPGARALAAQDLDVSGSILIQSVSIDGQVDFTQVTVSGVFAWSDIVTESGFSLVLDDAEVRTLADDEDSWPESGSLSLSGFVYHSLGRGTPTVWKKRMEWVQRAQSRGGFTSQPYTQLAQILEDRGDFDGARNVLKQLYRDRSAATANWPSRIWHFIYGFLAGYGYEPWRAFWSLAFFWMLGAVFFRLGFRSGNIQTRLPGGGLAPVFSSLLYSLDTLIPLLDLGQTKSFIVIAPRRGSRPGAKLLWIYQYLHALAGWFLFSLIFIAVTGLIKV
ncbi:hypothetical protein ACFLSG_04995, partial [Candidatus Bipolaricaulota bacterium]